MSWTLFFNQALNGFQFGVLLFLLATGLTLILGVMNFVNLAHGSVYMIGAYVAAEMMNSGSSFGMAMLVSVAACFALGIALDRLIASRLYNRDHLYQVLATFGLILLFNELVRSGWGAAPYNMPTPELLSGSIALTSSFSYPSYRLAIIAVGLAAAVGCSLLINKTRFGMLIRASATNATTVSALGVNVGLVNALLFGIGSALAGLAGVMVGPVTALQPGMGDSILILALVVIVVGGIGSVRGAFYGSLLVGLVDTLGRTLLPYLFRLVFERSTAQAVGPAVASMAIYLFMAAVLAFRPNGLFARRR